MRSATSTARQTNKATAEMLAMVVSMFGHDVRTAGDGQQALQVAAEFHPQVVLMDLGMPKMNGYEAAVQMRAASWGKDAVLIALTQGNLCGSTGGFPTMSQEGCPFRWRS